MTDIPLSDLIPFGEWLPDQADLVNPGSDIIRNVRSVDGKYVPFQDLQELSDSITAICKGAYSFTSSDGVVQTFAGTDNDLFQLSGSTTWTNVSSSTGAYNVPNDGAWVFKNYGDIIIAINNVDNIQEFTVGGSTTFADLSTTAPVAKSADVVNNFYAVVNTSDSSDGRVPNRVRWSPLDNPKGNWTPDPVTSSDFQNLEGDGGANQAIVGSQNYAVIVQERNIWRMEFVGLPTVFNFILVERNRGTIAPYSVVGQGPFVYYLGEDGFYVFNGSQSIPIGANKVNDFFFTEVDNENLFRIKAAVDPINNLVIWVYPDSNATLGNPNRAIIYNWIDDRWTDAIIDVDCVFTGLSAGFTLDELDSVTTNLDGLGFSLDSGVWAGGNTFLAGFSTNNKLSSFGGPNLEATLDTKEASLSQGRSFISSVLPIVDSSSATISVGTRNLQSDPIVFTSPASLNTKTGEASLRIDARYMRGRVVVPAGSSWNEAVGLQVRSVFSGRQ